MAGEGGGVYNKSYMINAVLTGILVGCIATTVFVFIQTKRTEARSIVIWHKNGHTDDGVKVYRNAELANTNDQWEMITIVYH
jgi:hypothetical protein